MIRESETRAVKKITRRVALEQAIVRQSDQLDGRAKEYAERLTQTKLDKTQVRGLEVLAYTTDKVSDVTDWLKSRVGRDDKRDTWGKEGVGRDLVAVLEGLHENAQSIADQMKKTYPLQEEDPDLERQVHLKLIREYLKHLAAHFEYAKVERKQ